MFKKIVSIAVAFCILMSCIAVGTFSAYAATSSSGVDYGLVENPQYGNILHCWNWSFNSIKNNLKKIAEQGFSAVQTSPIQASKESTKEYYSTYEQCWWIYYQPIGMNIETNSWNALGTKSEFSAMCTEAHKYGIMVIVDTVFNHMANDMGSGTINSQVISDIKDDSNCWHQPLNYEISNYSNRYDVTHYSLTGLPDLNTGDSKVQYYATQFLKECIDCGADGFRFDAAKHIETPSDAYGTGSDFWPNVLNAATSYAQAARGFTPYYYGEILDGTSGLSINAYTQYMSVTETDASKVIREGITNRNASAAATSSSFLGAAMDKTMYWVESHDTFAQESGYTRTIGSDYINRAWAIVGARNQASALYLARPSDWSTAKLGSADVTAWANKEVQAVNQFRNHFAGQSEYISSTGSFVYNERGTSGVAIVNVNGGASSVSLPAKKIYNGTYKDAITGNTFTVSNGYIYGNIGDTGIAVIYNEPPKSSVTPGTSSYRTDTLTLTLHCSNAAYGRYSFDDYNYTNFADGDKITIGKNVAVGGKTKIYVQAVNDQGVYSNLQNYTFTKIDPDTEVDIYFDNSMFGWPYTYAYIYNHEGEAAPWPGVQMTYDDNTDFVKVTVPVGFESGNVIFNNNSDQQTPSAGNSGYQLNATTCLFQNNTLSAFTPVKTEGISGNLYLKTSEWGEGATLKAYVWSGSGGAMVTFTDMGSGLYGAKLPDGIYKHATFYRINPEGTGSDWDNIWNQSASQLIPTGHNLFTLNSGEWNNANGTWSVYKGSGEIPTTAPTTVKPTTAPTTAPTTSATNASVYLAGSFNNWSSTANIMIPIDGVYTTTVELEEGIYTFKTVKDGTWYGNSGTIVDSASDWVMSSAISNDCILQASGGKYTFKYNVKTDSLTIDFVAAEKTSTVLLAGSFNNWSTTANKMIPIDGVYTTTIQLNADSYPFKIVVDGEWYGNGGTIVDTTTTTSAAGWTMSTSDANNCILQASGGEYTFRLDINTKSLIILHSEEITGSGSTGGVTATSEYYLGDTNEDGTVNISDGTSTQLYLARMTNYSENQEYLADVNGDSSVSIADVTYTQMSLAKMIDDSTAQTNSDGYSIGDRITGGENFTTATSASTPVTSGGTSGENYIFNINDVPDYSSNPYVEINNNQPYFTSDEKVTVSFETYGDLDELGRCSTVYACIGQDLMPTEERGSISSVSPTGWKSTKYDIVSGKYLYNRCHLIGWQLTGENANKKNLITGTRYLNVTGMLPYEDMVAEYVSSTDNHVLYRVTPIFEGNNLVASGVLMEGYSVEDNGLGICFNVYMYNVQPGITIDYATGNSWLTDGNTSSTTVPSSGNASSTGNVGIGSYVLNTNTKAIHVKTCPMSASISSSYKSSHIGSVDGLISNGYTATCSCMNDMATYAVNTSTKKIHTTSCRYATSSNVVTYTGIVTYLTDAGYKTCGTCNATDSTPAVTEPTESRPSGSADGTTYYISNTGKIHLSTCRYAVTCTNTYTGNVADLIAQGYTACGTCKPTADSTPVTDPTEVTTQPTTSTSASGTTYYISNTGKVHLSSCRYSASCTKTYTGEIEDILNQGYTACGTCKPASSTTVTTPTVTTAPTQATTSVKGTTYYISNTGKFHLSTCRYAVTCTSTYTGEADDLIAQGYTACGTCKPAGETETTPTATVTTPVEPTTQPTSGNATTYYLSNTGKIHLSTCRYTVTCTNTYTGNVADLIAQGYTVCGTCKPAGDITSTEATNPIEPTTQPTEPATNPNATTYYISNTGKVHLSTCRYAVTCTSTYSGDIDDLLSQGYTACGTCKPAGEITATETTVATEPTETTKATEATTAPTTSGGTTYYISNTGKVHLSTCRYAVTCTSTYSGDIDDLLSQGYTTCGTCKPS